jgi:hypothetical protein
MVVSFAMGRTSGRGEDSLLAALWPYVVELLFLGVMWLIVRSPLVRLIVGITALAIALVWLIRWRRSRRDQMSFRI